jgi:hypothetical protein
LADACFFVVALLVPSLEKASNLFSSVMILASFVVLVQAARDKLEPRLLFLIVSMAYVVMVGAGILLSVGVVATLGPARAQALAQEGMTAASLGHAVPWYTTGLWSLIGLFLIVAVGANVIYWKTTRGWD